MIIIHILPNISRSIDNQIMKLDQLIEYNKINIFLKKSYRNWVRKTSSRLYMRWMQVVCNLVSMYFGSRKLAYNKNKLSKTLDYWFRDMLNFDFSEKGLGLVSPPHFVYHFSRKTFLTLHSINWPNFIVWLPLLLEIFGSMCIAIIC